MGGKSKVADGYWELMLRRRGCFNGADVRKERGKVPRERKESLAHEMSDERKGKGWGARLRSERTWAGLALKRQKQINKKTGGGQTE